jgi:hypothetical protein
MKTHWILHGNHRNDLLDYMYLLYCNPGNEINLLP